MQLYGFSTLLATVRDLGSAIAKTVADCRHRGIPDLLCHYHFLAAVSQCLFDEDYAKLRGQLAGSKLRTRLRDLLGITRLTSASLRPRVARVLLLAWQVGTLRDRQHLPRRGG